MKFNDELEMLIKAALIDGKISEKEKEVLTNKAASMGIDKDEFLLVLEAREFEAKKSKSGGESSSEEEQKAKEWAKSLTNRIESTPPVYSPTGKYGKMELDRSKTEAAKEDRIKSAQPSNPYEYKEYLMLLEKYDLAKNSYRYLDFYLDTINQALSRYGKHPALKHYYSLKRKIKIRKTFAVLIPIVAFGAIIYMWAGLDWHWFGKLVLTIVGALFIVISISTDGFGLGDHF